MYMSGVSGMVRKRNEIHRLKDIVAFCRGDTVRDGSAATRIVEGILRCEQGT